MNIVAETLALRRQWMALAAKPEWNLLTRYDLLGKKIPSSMKERMWKRARRLLAKSGLIPPHVTTYPWLPTLKHAPVTAEAKTLLICALDVDRREIHTACEAFLKRLKTGVPLVPVLVTNVADFAYFSRLGWLVEYLPELDGEGRCYSERKHAYLAWRYRGACVVPLSAGLASETEWQALLNES